MAIPVHITFRGFDSSSAIEEYVRRRAAKLATFSDRITQCRVTLESPHHHRRHGAAYRVRVEVSAPGAELVIGRTADDEQHQDLYAAVDIEFDRATRVLQDFVRRQRGEIKNHANVV
jgi:ribosomal subunit interface protein